MKENFRRSAGMLTLLISLGILFWGAWPFTSQTRQMAVTAEEMQLPANVGAQPTETPPSTNPAVPEQRLLLLEVPEQLRNGDSGLIILSLAMDMQGQLTTTVQSGGEPVQVEPVEILDVYETHSVIVEARLDLAGMDYRPEGVVSEAMLPGKTVMFLWSIRPIEVGTYSGAVWLYLRFVPLAGGQETRTVLSAQRVEIEVVSLLGLKGSTARILGGLGAVLGSVLGLDGLLEFIWKRIHRVKKAKEQKKE